MDMSLAQQQGLKPLPTIHAAKKKPPPTNRQKRSPLLAGCKSQAALDSLPRNARGSNAAIHRLNARNAFNRSDLIFPSQSAESTTQPSCASKAQAASTVNASNGQSLGLQGVAAASFGTPSRVKRSISLNRSKSSGARTPLAKRAPPVSSGDLPIVSSDLELREEEETRYDVQNERGQTKSELELEEPARYRSRYQSLPSGPILPSPTKPFPSKLNPESTPSSPRNAQASKGIEGIGNYFASQSQGGQARKRVIDKSMIGKPTNFQHTGHIGAPSSRAALSPLESVALKAQISEVTAALKWDDLKTDLGNDREASDSTKVALSTTGQALMSRPAEAKVTPIKQEVSSHTGLSQAAGIVLRTHEIPSPLETGQVPTELCALPKDLSQTRSSSLAQPQGPAIDQSAPSKATRSYMPKEEAVVGGGGGGGGITKRKPVPQLLPEIPSLSPPQVSRGARRYPAVVASPDEHSEEPLSLGPTDLGRETSVVGRLPDVSSLGKYQSRDRRKSGRGSLARIPGQGSVGGDSTIKRWGLAEAFGDASSTLSPAAAARIADGTADQGAEMREEEEKKERKKEQKKMVEGPAGVYITDTANVRWNSAMDEIRKALAADQAEGEAGSELQVSCSPQDGDKGMEEGMRLADQVLQRLGVE